jgi:hypothetical protein
LTDRATLSGERVHRELQAYLDGREKWPTMREFARDGKSQLRRVLLWFDTPEKWASEFGVRIEDKQRSRRTRSYELLREEMAVFAAGRTDWPAWREFELAGRRRLYDQIMVKQLRPVLAAELGLKLSVRREPWTDEAIKAALDRFLKRRASWPTGAEFQRAGLGGLHSRLKRRHAQADWAHRYGFELKRCGSPLTGRGCRVAAAGDD